MEFLHEVYFGKTTSLLQLEELVEKVKIKYQNNLSTYAAFAEMKKDPIFTTMANIIKKQFGFETVILSPVLSPVCNCHVMRFFTVEPGQDPTTPTDYDEIHKNVVVTKDGIRFKGKAPSILVLLNTGFLNSPVLTSPEIVGIIMHEVGHAFTKPVMNDMVGNKYIGRVDEKFADSIATMYGYGPEISSGLNKMMVKLRSKGMNETIRKIPILNIGLALYQIGRDFVYRNLQGLEHPYTDERTAEILAQLESDLNNTPELSDEARKQIKEQIANIKSWLVEFKRKENLPDKMIRYYANNISSHIHIGKEAQQREFLRNNGSSDQINSRLLSIYNSSKDKR